MAKRYEIVALNGALVRQGQSIKSVECSERLSSGAVVEEIGLAGERLHYRLVQGSGPAEGWISLKVGGKDLAVQVGVRAAEPAAPPTVTKITDPSQIKPASFPPISEHMKSRMVLGKQFPFPKGKCYGSDGKMKMAFCTGACVNKTVGQMQMSTLLTEWTGRTGLQWTAWPGPHKVPLGWNDDFSLGAFGSDDITIMFERQPFMGCQFEEWDGIDRAVAEFKSFLKENGPFDGVAGFDMGGEFLLHIAKLATEGDADLNGMFRFMMLFTTQGPKRMSKLGKHLLTPPLRIPTLCSWDNSDPAHPHTAYEEACLLIDRDFREVINHQDGHKPPILKKDTEIQQRFVRFLEAMRTGSTFIPSDHAENHVKAHLCLPVVHGPPRALEPTVVRRLIVVPDPEGRAADLDEQLSILEAEKANGEILLEERKPWVKICFPPFPIERLKLRQKLYSTGEDVFPNMVAGKSIHVERVTYTSDMMQIKWTCAPEKVPGPQFSCKDVIEGELSDQSARDVASQLVASIERKEDEELALVGFGTGAFIAWAMARSIVEESNYVPAALYLVVPPTVLPSSCTASPGVLNDCAVHFLLDENSTCGPAWRYEISTFGPYKCTVFGDIEELAMYVARDFSRR